MGKKMGVNVTSRNLNADGLIKIDSANSLRRFNGANSWPTVSPPPSMERNLASDIKKFGQDGGSNRRGIITIRSSRRSFPRLIIAFVRFELDGRIKVEVRSGWPGSVRVREGAGESIGGRRSWFVEAGYVTPLPLAS